MNTTTSDCEASSNLGTISGKVLEDREGGMFQLAHATIAAIPGGSTKSDQHGTFVLTNLEPGLVTLTASHPGTASESMTATVVAGQTVTVEDFILVKQGTKS